MRRFKPSKLIPEPLRKFANSLHYGLIELNNVKVRGYIMPRTPMKESLRDLEELDTTNID